MIGAVTVQISNGELDPVRPAALNRYLSLEEWDNLVVSVHQIAFKGVQHNNMMTTMRYIFTACLVASFVSIMLLGPIGMALYFVFFILFLVSTIGCACYRHCVLGDAVEQELQQFLVEYSRKNRAGLTLHLLQDGSGAVRELQEGTKGARAMMSVDFVLQISVDQELGYHEMTSGSAPVYGAIVVEDDRDQIKVRLEKLERARQYLSSEEYNEKREAILNSI